MLYPLKHKIVCGFTRGLALLFYLALEYLIVARCYFSQVVDHARAIEREHALIFIEVAIRLIVVVTAGIILVRPYRVFGMDL